MSYWPGLASGLFYFCCIILVNPMLTLLTLAEAFHWVQVGFCVAVGAGIAYGAGWLLFLLFIAIADRWMS
jgi:hypothetical protein